MKPVFFINVIFWYLFSFYVQAEVLVSPTTDIDRYDWSVFNSETDVEEHIALRNRMYENFGPNPVFISYLNRDKSGLVRLEQEIELNNLGIKNNETLKRESTKAKATIQKHWENILNIEHQIQVSAGLSGENNSHQVVISRGMYANDFRSGMWDIYDGYYQIVLNQIEKKDNDIYKQFDNNDEAYAEFILPYVNRYLEKMLSIAMLYQGSLQSTYDSKTEYNDGDVSGLVGMYSRSFEMYGRVKDNVNGERIDASQGALIEKIYNWHIAQGNLGVDSLIVTYRKSRKNREKYGRRFDADSIVYGMNRFVDAPHSVKKKVVIFLRGDILEGLQNNEDRMSRRARIKALISLKYFEALTDTEELVFNKALREGVIENLGEGIKGDVFSIARMDYPKI